MGSCVGGKLAELPSVCPQCMLSVQASQHLPCTGITYQGADVLDETRACPTQSARTHARTHLDGEVLQGALAVEALQQYLTGGHDHLWALEEDACLLHHLRSIHAQHTLLLLSDAVRPTG